jgi:hypothetical protein
MTTLQSKLENLKQEGWARAATPPRRLICCIEGWDKTGKTHLTMSAPEPILYIAADNGVEGVVHKCTKEYQIFDVHPPARLGDIGDLIAKFKPIWEAIKKQISNAYEIGEGTLVIDSFTEIYDIARLAQFGKVAQVQPHEYQYVYAELRELIRMASASTMNTIFVNKMERDFNTGEPKPKGWSALSYEVQAVIRTQRDDSDAGPVFSAKVMTCRQNAQAMGKTLAAGFLNYDFLLNLVHGPK